MESSPLKTDATVKSADTIFLYSPQYTNYTLTPKQQHHLFFFHYISFFSIKKYLLQSISQIYNQQKNNNKTFCLFFF